MEHDFITNWWNYTFLFHIPIPDHSTIHFSSHPLRNIWTQFISPSVSAQKWCHGHGNQLHDELHIFLCFFGGACGVGGICVLFSFIFLSLLSLSCCGGLRVGELFFVDFLSTIILFSLAMLLARLEEQHFSGRAHKLGIHRGTRYHNTVLLLLMSSCA